MRRMDLHPRRRLRNPKRHIRSLMRWAETAHLHLPQPSAIEREAHTFCIRLPAYQKLCDPPHTTPELQHQCVEAMLIAAQNLRRHLNLTRPYRIALLLQTPHLWNSTIELVLDPVWPNSMFPPHEYKVSKGTGFEVESLPPNTNILTDLKLVLPTGYALLSGIRHIEREYGEPEPHVRDYHQWIIAEV